MCRKLRSGLALLWLCAAASVANPARADTAKGVAAYRAGYYEAAFVEFGKAAEAGDPLGQFNLAVMYLTGRGVKRDVAKSVEWHRKAAENGLAAAQHGLGVLYYQGTGVEQDFDEALKWFHRAAAQQFANSEFNIAVMHFNKQSLARNDYEIVKWVSLAAARGFGPAQYRLGEMYEKAIIVDRDLAEALRWYKLAIRNGQGQVAERAIARVESAAAKTAAETNPPDSAASTTNTADTAHMPERRVPDASSVASAETTTKPNEEEKSDRATPAPPNQPASDTAPEQEAGEKAPEPAADTRTERIPENSAEAASGAVMSLDGQASDPPEPETDANGTVNNLPVELSEKPGDTQTAALAPPQTEPPAREWRVQFAAYRSENDAEKAWNALTRRARGVLNGMTPIIERADLGDRGVYHRLQAGPLDGKSVADGLCGRLRNVLPGQGCITVRIPQRAN